MVKNSVRIVRVLLWAVWAGAPQNKAVGLEGGSLPRGVWGREPSNIRWGGGGGLRRRNMFKVPGQIAATRINAFHPSARPALWSLEGGAVLHI
jgi:hypothetical protein